MDPYIYAMDNLGKIEFGSHESFFERGKLDWRHQRKCPFQCGEGKILWEEGYLTEEYHSTPHEERRETYEEIMETLRAYGLR